MTTYILVGVTLEERDLVRAFGDQYEAYRAEVPMFVPRPWRSIPSAPDDANAD
jgi:protein-S-isoprenylcysteine O-methyltransferase Ste14